MKLKLCAVRTGPSVSEAAWGKLNLTAKAITEGGFESLFKQTFATEVNEKLMKSFACYLSTETGPVAGTLYLSTARVAFCSDRPLSFTAPSGQVSWSYYKVKSWLQNLSSRDWDYLADLVVGFGQVMIPLGHVATVNPVTMPENPSARYLQISTVDGHEFWFMGFVNFEKATHHLLNAVSAHNAPPVSA